MTRHAIPLAARPTHRRALWPVVLLGVLAGSALLLLWWFDPRQLDVPLCGFHAMTGFYCPGCGAVRATHELLHGRVLSAFSYNALWIVSLPVVLYTVASEMRYLVGSRRLPGDLLRKRWFLLAAVSIAMLFGLLRNVPCYPWTLLAPPG